MQGLQCPQRQGLGSGFRVWGFCFHAPKALLDEHLQKNMDAEISCSLESMCPLYIYTHHIYIYICREVP